MVSLRAVHLNYGEHGVQPVGCKAPRAQVEMPVPPIFGKESKAREFVSAEHHCFGGAFIFIIPTLLLQVICLTSL